MPKSGESSVTVHPIKPAHPYKHPPVKFKVLPQHEYSMLIVAPKGSGKTNLICNLLLNHYKGYFHRILVCSPTVENDEKWDVVKKTTGILAENKVLKEILGEKLKRGQKEHPQVVHKSEGHANEYVRLEAKGENKFDGKIPEGDFFEDLDEVPKRLHHQRQMMSKLREMGYGDKCKYLVDRVLVIEDDQAGLYKSTANNNPQANLTFKHRHYGASLIKVTQQYKAIPKGIRTNMNALACFEIPNQSELESIYEEWPMYMKREPWMQLFEYATREPFAFIYMNNHFPKGQRVYKNFEKLLTIHENGNHVDEQDCDHKPVDCKRYDGKVSSAPARHPDRDGSRSKDTSNRTTDKQDWQRIRQPQKPGNRQDAIGLSLHRPTTKG